jgi:hypothetical protein
MNDRADWVAWSLQFALGLVVGAALGFGYSWGRAPLVRAESRMLAVVGAALLGAALASGYGDELWLGSHRGFRTDAPRHSRTSRAVSLVVGCVGGGLILVVLGRSLGLS